MRGKLAVDAVALVAYVIVSLPSLTGVAFHEWLGLAVFVVLAVHLAQHLYQVILKRAPASDGAARRATPARVARAVLAVLLAVALMVCVVSGVMVPAFGLYAEGYYFWNPLHAVSAKVLLALLLIHLFLNAGMAYRLLQRKKPSAKKETEHDRDR